jgi:FAD/FMN-containing dehydrogenase
MNEAATGGKEPVTPADIDDLSSILRRATEAGNVVQVVGGGTRQGYGSPAPADIVLDMSCPGSRCGTRTT